MTNVEAQFKAALNVIQSLPKNGPYKPSHTMMLQFYSLYKQATEGRCNRAKPWAFDVVNKAKWDAWNKLGDMSKEEAMKNYVEELTKVMKDFPLPSDDQIIEALPANDKAVDFVNTLGHFYEIVDPKSNNAKELKIHAGSRKLNGDHEVQSGNGDFAIVNHNLPVSPNCNSPFDNKKLGDGVEKLSSESDVESSLSEHNKKFEEASFPSQNTDHFNESDDEFCDTSADISNLDGRHQDDSESPTISTLSSSSVNESPSNLNTTRNSDKVEEESLIFAKQPRTRGGEQGTHGIDKTAHFSVNGSQQQIGQNRFLAKECSSVSHHPISSASGGSGGGNEDGNLAESKRQSEVQERIAVALLQLQRDMHSVLNRLTTLETITISRHQDMQRYGSEKRPSWWPFEDLSPKTTLFLIVWPFLARLFINIFTKSKSRRKY